MDHNGNQFDIPVSRGIKLHSGNNFSVKPNLGMHWSKDKNVAAKFGGAGVGLPENIRVFHGHARKQDVETNPKILKARDVTDPGHAEQEVPLKEGATVKITGESRFRGSSDSPKERRRSYNPPREMKA